MIDKIIVPYVIDDEHAAPKFIRVGAYPQVHTFTSSPLDWKNEVLNVRKKSDQE
jgi:hypothetical protein